MRSRLATKDQYFCFLKEIVCDGFEQVYCYSSLLELLHSISFYSIVANDENRIEDGLQLRNLFCEKEKLRCNSASFFCPNEECSVLEMLIALSIRMATWLEATIDEKTEEECFWMLINNLGLSNYTDDYDGPVISFEENVDDIIDDFLKRKYRKNGLGGLFPLKWPKKDQRKIEIWYQMAEWVQENFEF